MSRAAIRYAKAVLQHADKVNATKAVFEDMQTIHSTIKASKDLRLMLKSPIIKGEDKKQSLGVIFSDQSEITKGLMELLIDNKRSDILGGVATSYIELYNKARGVKVARVTTAIPLTEELQDQVLTRVEEMTRTKRVTIENTIDESILGGFILRVGDLQYDASIANKLEILKREFSKS